MSYQHQGRGVRASRRDKLSYWLPLVLTVSAAALGIATWIWVERKDDDELPRGPPGNNSYSSQSDDSQSDDKIEVTRRHGNDATPPLPSPLYSQGYMARMSGALRRTPSPQQIFDGASRSIVGGINAASAVVGTALGSIIEQDKNAYKDHKTWSEEVESRKADFDSNRPSLEISNQSKGAPDISTRQKTQTKNVSKRTVAIVLSADNGSSQEDEDQNFHEHASILSYLPHNIDFSKIRVFILIYCPLLKVHPLDASTPRSSYKGSTSQIPISQTELAEKLSDEIRIPTTNSIAFDRIYYEALEIVEKESMVLPFTSETGHVQILRHLNPDIIYLQESLSGISGEVVTNLQTWLRRDMVLVIGDGCSSSGLADSESEIEPSEDKNRWWKREDRVGKGRGVIVLEAFRVGDDWAKRIENKE